ncbi:unnamed protein product [Ilex paraguariensis]|uniref:Uncharacterized protein n=1 Tax=Ilex paraguariensis TaxID=185542 RepID=A0ABC8TG14_9AQUA
MNDSQNKSSNQSGRGRNSGCPGNNRGRGYNNRGGQSNQYVRNNSQNYYNQQYSQQNYSSQPCCGQTSNNSSIRHSYSQTPLFFQICNKRGHMAIECYHRLDYAYQGRNPSPQLSGMTASAGSPIPNQWLTDTGASHHITSDLANLQIHSPYCGEDKISVGNGQELKIIHSGQSILNTTSPFKLTNIL